MPAAHPSGYQTPDALWRAVNDRIKQRVKADPELTTTNLQRQFVYDRFLARVFYASEGNWVLKGGTALLARVRSARHSKDLDLFRRDGTLETAIAELQVAAAIDLQDHFRFVLQPERMRQERPGQPGNQLATIAVDAYAGVRPIERFTVDVVVGSIITAEPDIRDPAPIISTGNLITSKYLLYPVPDHVADKVCATFGEFGTSLAASSRDRDMVDLVVIARTQRIDAAQLHRAIEAERLNRGLGPITKYETPNGWRTTYARRARDVAHCQQHTTYAEALDLISRFLDPVLDGSISAGTWDPTELRWRVP